MSIADYIACGIAFAMLALAVAMFIRHWNEGASTPSITFVPPFAFNFPVNVPDFTRDDRIALSAFLSTPTGGALLLRMRATLCNNAIAAGDDKQFAAQRAAEAHGYSECLTQLVSLSVVPTASDMPASGQLDEAGRMLNKFSS